MPYATVNGARLFYADDDFVAPWLPHEVAFLQPWVMGNHRDWWSHVPVIGSRFRVLCMDRRGFGLSDVPPASYEYTLDGLLADFAAFLDVIGVKRIHYVGESFGALLGMAFAAKYPGMVSSLVLCHAPTSFPGPIDMFERVGFAEGALAVEGMGGWAYAQSLWTQRERVASDGLIQMLERAYRAEQQGRVPAHVQAALLRLSFAKDFDIAPLLSGISAPTLIIRPDHSPVTTEDQQDMVARQIANSEVAYASRTADGFTWTDPVECARMALEFISRHSAAHAWVDKTSDPPI